MKLRSNRSANDYAVQHRTSLSPEQRQAKMASQQRRRLIGSIAWKGAVLLFIISILVFLARITTSAQPGEAVTDMGNTHLSADSSDSNIVYTSKPPTSGPHEGSLAQWGVNEEPIPDAVQIHNLEDGGVGIWYDCPENCPDLVNQLVEIVEDVGENGLLLAPYPDMESTIALTAWNRIDRFEEFDAIRIKAFINAYRGIDHHR